MKGIASPITYVRLQQSATRVSLGCDDPRLYPKRRKQESSSHCLMGLHLLILRQIYSEYCLVHGPNAPSSLERACVLPIYNLGTHRIEWKFRVGVHACQASPTYSDTFIR